MSPPLLLLAGQLFFLEAQPGVQLGEEPAIGPSLAVEAGCGGSWNGSRMRFFLVTRLEGATVDYEGAQLPVGDRSSRSYGDASVGLRFLYPLTDGLRLYVDLLTGGSFVHAELERPGLPGLRADRTLFLAQTALGLQVRPSAHFSYGLRVQLSAQEVGPDLLAIAAGEKIDPLRATAALTFGAHF
jgi:hypothetical protein